MNNLNIEIGKNQHSDRTINSVESFYKIHKWQIEDAVKNLRSQFRSITYGPQTAAINIVQNQSTSVETKRKISDTGKEIFDFTLNINFDDLKLMYETHLQYDILECFNKIIAHEFLHILKEHINYRFGNLAALYAYGLCCLDNNYRVYDPTDEDEQNKMENKVINFNYSKYFNPGKFYGYCDRFITSDDRNKIKSQKYHGRFHEKFVLNWSIDGNYKVFYNHKIANIAYDFVINEELGIYYPFMRPENFDLEPGLNELDYYSILEYEYKMAQMEIEEDLKNGGTGVCSSSKRQKIKDAIDDYNFDTVYYFDEGLVDNNKRNPFSKIFSDEKVSKKRNDEEIKNMVSKCQGYNGEILERFNKRNDYNAKVIKRLLNELEGEENNTKLSSVEKRNDWGRLNNRRGGSNLYPLDSSLVYPGKIEKSGNAFDLKFAPSSVIFIDVSSSMNEFIPDLYALSYYALNIGITIAFYNHDLVEIFENANDLKFGIPTNGGTCLSQAVKTYLKKKKIKNIYIFSDGMDGTIDYIFNQSKYIYDGNITWYGDNKLNRKINEKFNKNISHLGNISFEEARLFKLDWGKIREIPAYNHNYYSGGGLFE